MEIEVLFQKFRKEINSIKKHKINLKEKNCVIFKL